MKTSKQIALAIASNNPEALFAAITVATGSGWTNASIERHIVDNGGKRLLARARKLSASAKKRAGKAGIVKLGARLAKHRKAIKSGRAERGTMYIAGRVY